MDELSITLYLQSEINFCSVRMPVNAWCYIPIESSSLVPVLFREVFSHPYISLSHLLVNGFSVTCFRTFF